MSIVRRSGSAPCPAPVHASADGTCRGAGRKQLPVGRWRHPTSSMIRQGMEKQGFWNSLTARAVATERRGLLAAMAVAAAVVAARPAAAVVTEPNGLAVPIVNSAEDVATTVAYGRHSTLDLLFSSRGETIDSRADASTTQTAFSPRCNFAGSLVLHGGACQMDFGWYNVDPASSVAPSDDEIFVLVPRDANL